MRHIIFIIFIFLNTICFSQIKNYEPTKISSPIKIDGKPNDAAWANVAILNDFIIASPDFGKQPTKKTEVKIVYDNAAVYVLAILYDDAKNIRRQFTQRDNIERQDCDAFSVGFDPYLDKQNGFIFQVSAAGVQGDARQSSANGTDRSWDAVWESAVTIEQDKWIVEFKIPFSALRFSKKNMLATVVLYTSIPQAKV